MTPKEKAIELVEKFKELYDYGSLGKDCALIAVDEIINVTEFFELEYWYKVKQEIEKL